MDIQEKNQERESLYNDRIKETIETYNVSAKAYQDKFMEMDLYNDTYDTFCHLINNSSFASGIYSFQEKKEANTL